MAIVNFTGFETGDFGAFSIVGGTGSVQSSVVHTGNFAARVNPTGSGTGSARMQAVDNTNGTINNNIASAAIITFWFRVDTAPASGDEIVVFADSAGSGGDAEFRINSSRIFAFYANGGSLIETGSTALSLNTWYKIEVLFGQGSDNYHLKINDVTDLSGTTTQVTQLRRVIFGKVVNRNSNSVDFYYDDISIDTDVISPASISDSVVKGMYVTGDGNYTAWTGDSTAVDEAMPHDSDTSYITSSTSGQVETFDLDDASSAGISGTVYAVKGDYVVRDEGGSSAIRYRLRSDTTDTDSSNNDPGSSYGHRAKLLETDPATGVAWVLADLDNIELGVNNQANVAVRCTMVMAEVLFTPDSGEQLVNVGQVTETDTSQSIRRNKNKLLTKSSETETANGITRNKSLGISQVTETDSPQDIGVNKEVAVGQASESDTSQTISRVKYVDLPKVSEIDAAFTISVNVTSGNGGVNDRKRKKAVLVGPLAHKYGDP